MKNKCKVKKCNRSIYSKKNMLCNAHYQRLRLQGTVNEKIPIKRYSK